MISICIIPSTLINSNPTLKRAVPSPNLLCIQLLLSVYISGYRKDLPSKSLLFAVTAVDSGYRQRVR